MAFLKSFKSTVFIWFLGFLACGNQPKTEKVVSAAEVIHQDTVAQKPVIVAANRTAAYLSALQGKKVGVVANQTSVIFKEKGVKAEDGRQETGDEVEINEEETDTRKNNEQQTKNHELQTTYTHLVDSLLSLDIAIKKVFAPEHGFRGAADAGEEVKDEIDTKTGLPLISLHGKNRKPTADQLKDLDVVLFDIQDVGVRFYTYIATLQLVMEACAVNQVPVIVLDRPNPNAHYVDGPTMKKVHTSFLGMTEIPLVYGMTIGEYAQMINGEGWLEGGKKADLKVIALENWSYNTEYSLPVRPSPNLPSDQAINLYPSLALFEGTNINAGRGTEYQFQRYGASFLDSTQYSFSYTPKPNFGSKNPKEEGKICFGKDLAKIPKMSEVSLQWLIDAYINADEKSKVFNTDGFTAHAGTTNLQKQIEKGLSEAEIKATWQPDLEKFKKIREKYSMY